MTQRKGSLLKSLERKDSRNTGLYGSMVADQNYIATFGHNCDIDDECVHEFDRLNGPEDTSNGWVPIEKLTYSEHDISLDQLDDYGFNSLSIENFELDPAVVKRMQMGMSAVSELTPHLEGRKAYFREVDNLRKRVLSALSLETLYALIDEMNELDDVCLATIDGWKLVKTTFERLEPQLVKVEKRIRERQATFEKEKLDRETYLIKIGYIKKESEPIGV
jgi:hypothetical protein